MWILMPWLVPWVVFSPVLLHSQVLPVPLLPLLLLVVPQRHSLQHLLLMPLLPLRAVVQTTCHSKVRIQEKSHIPCGFFCCQEFEN